MNKKTLKSDAPGLYKDLKRIFQDKELNILDKAYAESSINESPAVRDPETSFTPRPARLCSILISDTGVRDLDLFLNAMQEDTRDEAIILAQLLDNIRHVHFTEQPREYFTEYQSEYKEIKTNISSRFENLAVKIEQALRLYERKITDETND